MPKLKRTLLSTIPAKDITKLSKYAEEHCLKNYDEASELYNQILQSPRKNIVSDGFIEMVYKMLVAFKMNSRGAKLSELPDFKKSIKEHADTIQSLAKFKLEEIKQTDDKLIKTISGLFDELKLVKTGSPLVTFSKAMHFFLPNLFMPIDRKYTLQFFYGRTPVNQKECFLEVFEQFRQFACEYPDLLKSQVDSSLQWNRNIPKLIDNIIIAYVKCNMED